MSRGAAGGYDPRYYSRLADLEARSFWFRSRNELIVWALRRYFPDAESLLEIGCGTGFVLRGIRESRPSMRLAGSELHAEGLAVAAIRLPGVELLRMDARGIPFEEAFDVIGAFDLLEHIPEDEEVLAQMYRAVASGGGILLTVPQHPRLYGYADERAGHVRRYDSRGLRSKIERAGFEVIRMTSFLSLLLPAMALSRARRPRPGGDPLAIPGLEVPGPLDALLGGVQAVERGMIRLGVSLPAGGSLLVAGRKPRGPAGARPSGPGKSSSARTA